MAHVIASLSPDLLYLRFSVPFTTLFTTLLTDLRSVHLLNSQLRGAPFPFYPILVVFSLQMSVNYTIPPPQQALPSGIRLLDLRPNSNIHLPSISHTPQYNPKCSKSNKLFSYYHFPFLFTPLHHQHRQRTILRYRGSPGLCLCPLPPHQIQTKDRQARQCNDRGE